MSQRAAVNLGLAALVLALGALAYFRPGVERGPAHAPLSSLDADSVSRLRIVRGGGHEIRMERTAEGWQMRQPYDQPADPARVGRLLAILGAPSERELTPDPAGLAAYGLARPSARLEANDEVLEIGGTEPLGGHRYVRFQGRVHLIDNASVYLLLTQPEFFLDRRLLRTEPHPLAAVELPGPRVFQGEGGRWSIDPPTPAVAPKRLSAWMQAWREARALEVLPAPSDRGEPVRLRFADSSPPRVLELIRGKRLLLIDRRRGLAYHLPADSPLIRRPQAQPHD